MPGTIKIWWHDGAVKDVRYNDLPVVNEPELGFETVAVETAVPAASGAAPVDATVAIVETSVDIRYRVRREGGSEAASATDSKPLRATGLGTDSIGVSPGQTISFIEV